MSARLANVVIRVNITSGTSDKPRFIPVTPRGWNAAARVSLLWLRRAVRDHPGFLDCSVLSALGPAVESRTPARISFGGASGMNWDCRPPRGDHSYRLRRLLG